MNPTSMRVSRRGAAALATLALSVTGVAVMAPAVAQPVTTDAGEEMTVSDAILTWGVKQSFRNYVSGSIAGGSVTTLGATTQRGDGAFTWQDGSGSVAEDNSSGSIYFDGDDGVRFQGHEMDGGYALDMSFTNPRVVLTSPTAGELRVDASGVKFESMTEVGPEYSFPDVLLAHLDLTDASIEDETITIIDAPATLASGGVEAFGGFYDEGEELDPVSLTGTVTAEPEPEPAPEPVTSVAVTGADSTDGLTIHVSGQDYLHLPTPTSGSDPAGVYAAVIDANTVSHGDVGEDTALAVEFIPGGEASWAQIHNGQWSKDLTVAASDLTEDMNLEVLVWSAHGNVTHDTLIFNEHLTLTNDQREALFPPPDQPGDQPGAGPVTEVDVSVSAVDGLVLAVTGTDYVDLPKPIAYNGTENTPMGVYVTVYDANTTTVKQISDDQAGLADAWIINSQITDGGWSTTLKVPAEELTADGDYKVITWPAHGVITEDNLIDIVPVTLTDRQKRELGLIAAEDDSPAPRASVDSGTINLAGKRTQTVTASGFAPGEDVEVTLHSDAITLGTTPADSAGKVSYSFTVPTSIAPGEHRVVLRGLSSGVQISTSFMVIDKKEGAPGTDSNPKGEDRSPKGQTEKASSPRADIVCTEDVVPAKPGTSSLSWGVKSSFVSYIQGGIAKGSITPVNGAARNDNGFTWGAGSGSLNSSGVGTVTFPGSIHFTGHDGVLDLRISNLQVRSTGGNSGTLVAFVKSQDMEGKSASNGTVTLANLSFSSLSSSGGNASVSLTSEGAKAFAGFYSAGQEMDDLRLSISAGQDEQTIEVCYDRDGNRVNPDGTPYMGDDDMPATGTDTTWALTLMVALILTGGALIASKRNRSRAI